MLKSFTWNLPFVSEICNISSGCHIWNRWQYILCITFNLRRISRLRDDEPKNKWHAAANSPKIRTKKSDIRSVRLAAAQAPSFAASATESRPASAARLLTRGARHEFAPGALIPCTSQKHLGARSAGCWSCTFNLFPFLSLQPCSYMGATHSSAHRPTCTYLYHQKCA